MSAIVTKRIAATIAAAALVTTGLAGAAVPAHAAAATTLTIGYDSDPAPTSYDPALYSTGQRLFMESLYDSLFYPDGKGGVLPGLAETYSQSADKTQLTMNLRPNVTFSDGSILDGSTVKANIERVFTDNKTNYASLQSFVSGGSAEIKSVSTNGNSVTITFAKAQATAPTLFTGESGMIVAQSQATIHNQLATAPDGSGPYRMVKAGTIRGNTYKLVKNPKYWDSSKYPYTNLTYKVLANAQARANALATGQVDIAAAVDGSTVSFLQSRKAGLVSLGGYQSMLVFWNGGQNPPGPKPLVGDKNVRLALSYATDREALVTALNKGDRATASYIPKELPGYDAALETTYAYNPDKAKQLLAAAGVTNLTLTTVYGDPSQAALFTALAAQWAKVGVTLNAHLAANSGELFGAVGSEAFGYFQTAVTDANSAGLAAGVFVSGFANFMHTQDAVVNAALGPALGAPSATTKKALNDALVNEAWLMPLREGYSYTGYNTKTVKAPVVGVDGANPMLWDIKKK